MTKRLDIIAFPAELKSTLDISDAVKKDQPKAPNENISDKSSVTAEAYNSGCQLLYPALCNLV